MNSNLRLASSVVARPLSAITRRAMLVALTCAVAVATTTIVRGQGAALDAATLPKSAGVVIQQADGSLLVATGARINQRAGAVDKLGSFFVGLGYAAPDFDSAALSLMRFTPRGVLDARFGNGGIVMTPLLPLRNRHRATVTSLLQDSAGRLIVVGWREQSTALDANFLVITAARYTAAGALDTSFGERGIVTMRLDQAGVTQAFAAALDAQGRLLVAGYTGGRLVRGSQDDDWSIRSILLRYTTAGILDTSFGERGVASQALDPSGADRRDGRDFLRYDYKKAKTAGLVLDRQGRAVVAASNGEGIALLTRYTADGRLDPSFGRAGIVHPAVGGPFSISNLSWDAAGRLLAVGTSSDRVLLVRYSADGAPDTTYGTNGMGSAPILAGLRVSAALHESDGHVLAVASGENGVQLARFDGDGKPDMTFGPQGVIHRAAGRRMAIAAGLAIDAAGIPTVAVPSDDGIFMMRFERPTPVDVSFRPTTPARR